ncbi:MAG: DUF4266 domain-containing protein [Bacteroidota bacterium]
MAKPQLRVLMCLCVLCGCLVLLAGCGTVKSFDKGKLGDPIMERQDHFAKQTLEQKFFTTREGSIGGAGGIGGGCGCAK